MPHEVLTPNEQEVGNESEIITQALSNPIGTETFEDFSRSADKLLVLVNDATRPTPTAQILEKLQDTLREHTDLKFLVATGSHRAPTDKELRAIFGDLYDEFKDRVFIHDARKDEDMVYLGESTLKTPIYLNRLVTEMRNILVIGSVEPHYFAGYTGGRKAFLPGVASYQTIETNHKHALCDGARTLALEGNPVAEDMNDAMKVLKDMNVFSIQSVLTGDHSLYAMTTGDLIKSFDAATAKANDVFGVRCRRKGNIVLTAAPYPMDIDLYQSQKALENGKLALEKGGVIIMASKCREGVGEDTFLELLGSASTCEEVMAEIAKKYKLGYHKAAKIAQIGTWARMWAVSDLDDETLKRSKLEPQPGIQKAFDRAIALIRSQDKEPYAVIMPQGSLTIPLIE
ncbi:MAG: nickel-dependent lactate racemase [Euryarchaeota archaeon]|nr:nickel-dependent lactate racemase [Euryarchaeota archaeon]